MRALLYDHWVLVPPVLSSIVYGRLRLVEGSRPLAAPSLACMSISAQEGLGREIEVEGWQRNRQKADSGLGCPSWGWKRQELWTGGFLSCWLSKATKNTAISMRPLQATASKLSLPSLFSLLEQKMQPAPENNCSFPVCLYSTGPLHPV